ncbi:MAG: ChbG/HpnK family deacetylase [bacterium]
MKLESSGNKKLLIFNADDFGINKDFNEGVKIGYKEGFLTSACLCANGEAFEHAIKEVLPECEEMGLGVHLNIMEGKTTLKNYSASSLLCSSDGTYQNSFHSLLAKSKNKKLLLEIEHDFRNQIELILSQVEVDHLNSHVHIHAIPPIFEITCKLAKEYNITYVRTQYEKPYVVPQLQKHLNLWYPLNTIKVALLNHLSAINHKTAAQYGVKTNDYIIGVAYTGFMDSQTIESGLNSIKDKNCITEMLIHPCKFKDLNPKNPRYIEFLTTQDLILQEKIKSKSWILTNYKKIDNC